MNIINFSHIILEYYSKSISDDEFDDVFNMKNQIYLAKIGVITEDSPLQVSVEIILDDKSKIEKIVGLQRLDGCFVVGENFAGLYCDLIISDGYIEEIEISSVEEDINLIDFTNYKFEEINTFQL
jgi:hypothetical protein